MLRAAPRGLWRHPGRMGHETGNARSATAGARPHAGFVRGAAHPRRRGVPPTQRHPRTHRGEVIAVYLRPRGRAGRADHPAFRGPCPMPRGQTALLQLELEVADWERRPALRGLRAGRVFVRVGMMPRAMRDGARVHRRCRDGAGSRPFEARRLARLRPGGAAAGYLAFNPHGYECPCPSSSTRARPISRPASPRFWR